MLSRVIAKNVGDVFFLRHSVYRGKHSSLQIQNQHNIITKLQRCELTPGNFRVNKELFRAIYIRVKHF